MKFYFNRIKTKEFSFLCVVSCLTKAYWAIIWILFCLPFGYGIQFLVDAWIYEFVLRTRARSFAFLYSALGNIRQILQYKTSWFCTFDWSLSNNIFVVKVTVVDYLFETEMQPNQILIQSHHQTVPHKHVFAIDLVLVLSYAFDCDKPYAFDCCLKTSLQPTHSSHTIPIAPIWWQQYLSYVKVTNKLNSMHIWSNYGKNFWSINRNWVCCRIG